MRARLAVAVVALVVVPSIAVASPVTLSYAGSVSSLSPLFAGAQITMDWHVDSGALDSCANSLQGVFGPFGSRWTIDMTIGGVAYATQSGELLLNANESGGCNGSSYGSAELRAVSWTGSSQPGFTFMPLTLFGILPGLVFQTPTFPGDNLPAYLDSAFVRTLFITGPYFRNEAGSLVALQASVSMVPEPGTWLLLLTGLAAVSRRVVRTRAS